MHYYGWLLIGSHRELIDPCRSQWSWVTSLEAALPRSVGYWYSIDFLSHSPNAVINRIMFGPIRESQCSYNVWRARRPAERCKFHRWCFRWMAATPSSAVRLTIDTVDFVYQIQISAKHIRAEKKTFAIHRRGTECCTLLEVVVVYCVQPFGGNVGPFRLQFIAVQCITLPASISD